jgi:hypothetical protein
MVGGRSKNIPGLQGIVLNVKNIPGKISKNIFNVKKHFI